MIHQSNNCYVCACKDNNWSAAKKVPGTAVKVTKNPMKKASRLPANVKEGMMVAAKDRAQAKRR